MIFFVLLVAAVSVATIYLIQDPGYVFVQWGAWQVELSVALSVTVLAVFVLIAYILIALFASLIAVPGRIKNAVKINRERKSRLTSTRGYMHLVQGDWNKAEKLLNAAIADEDSQVMGRLAAAYSAQQRGDSAKRDGHLDKAQKNAGEFRPAVDLVRARLLIEDGKPKAAAEVLQRLRRSAPNNAVVLRLLSEIHVRQGEFNAAFDLLPQLRKANAYSQAELEAIEAEVIESKFASIGLASELLKLWKSLASASRSDTRYTVAYVKKLLEFGRYQEAERVIRESIAKSWNSELAYLYGCIEGSMDASRMLAAASEWESKRPNDARLLLTLGKLAHRCGKHKDAAGYLERSIRLQSNAEAYFEFGRLMDSQGDAAGASDAFKSGMQALSGAKATPAASGS